MNIIEQVSSFRVTSGMAPRAPDLVFSVGSRLTAAKGSAELKVRLIDKDWNDEDILLKSWAKVVKSGDVPEAGDFLPPYHFTRDDTSAQFRVEAEANLGGGWKPLSFNLDEYIDQNNTYGVGIWRAEANNGGTTLLVYATFQIIAKL